MENIKYSKTRPEKAYNVTVNKEWFGNNSSLSGTHIPLYEDNSFAKHDYIKAAYKRRLQTYNRAYSVSKHKVENFRNQLHFSMVQQRQLMVIYQRKTNKRLLMERSAVKIQKVIRGSLTRKKYFDVSNI